MLSSERAQSISISRFPELDLDATEVHLRPYVACEVRAVEGELEVPLQEDDGCQTTANKSRQQLVGLVRHEMIMPHRADVAQREPQTLKRNSTTSPSAIT